MSSSEVDEPLSIVSTWLQSLEAASVDGDVDIFTNLFLLDGWLRDFLCFSWDFRTLSGAKAMKNFLSEESDNKTRLAAAGLNEFKVETTTTIEPPAYASMPGDPNVKGIQSAFTFSITSPPAIGRGFVRLVQDSNGSWKAFTVLTSLDALVGHEEAKDRPFGFINGHMRTWAEVRAEKAAAIEKDPTVLIVGGGQAGLMCAARMGRMGIRALVLEKSARVGNVWRERYPNLTLHTTAHHCSMLYHPWPKTYPKFLPKDIVADFLEAYSIGQELQIWLSSTVLPNPSYDSSSGRWTVTVNRSGKQVTVTPKHIVVATGNGIPKVPSWPGIADFKGPLYHSDEHRGAAPYKGQRVVVIGACNAAADICQDFVAKGASEVTMVQRSATCVLSLNSADKAIFSVGYPESRAVEDADFMSYSIPNALALKLALNGGTQQLKDLDKELHEGLTKAGFKLTWEETPGGGEVGLLGFLFERVASGTMLDVGCGPLIISGKVKVKQGVEVDRFESTGVRFKDGTKLLADVVVLATGNQPMIHNATTLFGKSIINKIGSKIWGLDHEGEILRCYRPTGQPGLWFAPGSFQNSRFFSKHLGIHILAEEIGLK